MSRILLTLRTSKGFTKEFHLAKEYNSNELDFMVDNRGNSQIAGFSIVSRHCIRFSTDKTYNENNVFYTYCSSVTTLPYDRINTFRSFKIVPMSEFENTSFLCDKENFGNDSSTSKNDNTFIYLLLICIILFFMFRK